MESLLFLAKAYCIEEGSSVIGLTHFGKALAHCDITHSDAAIFLARRFPGAATATRHDADRLLAIARNSEDRLHIADPLMHVLRRLESFGSGFYAVRTQAGGTGLSPALLKTRQMREILERELFGQEAAVTALSSAVARQQSRPGQKQGVAGLYLLAGPPASGKSLAASLMARALGGDYEKYVYDMTVLSNPNDECSLVGTRQNFTNSRPGELTKFVHEHPETVVVLDNIDKSHPAIQQTIYQLLDDGYLTDRHGLKEGESSTRVDFRSVHMVLVTDQGESFYDQPALVGRLRAEGGEAQVRHALMQALAATRNTNYNNAGPAFSPALLSRLQKGEIVLFNRLDFDSLRRIAERGLAQASRTFASVSGLKHAANGTDNDLLDLMVLGQGRPDARWLSETAIYNQWFAPLEQRLIKAETKRPIKFGLAVTPEARAALAGIRKELGADPVHALFRLNRRVCYETGCESARGLIQLSFDQVRLERIAAADDFGGKGGFAIEVPDTSLADVAGHDKLKAKLREQVALLRDPSALKARGVEPPRGMLLHGQPGSGKTLVARALAKEAGMPFLAVVATEFFDLEMIRQTFARLRKYAPAMLFIDELDALGRRGQNGADPAINALLAEIDGFQRSESPIFVVAATNYRDKVDPALLRPGRLELGYEVDELDRSGRIQMLDRIAPIMARPESLERLASYTSGMTGAQMAAALRDAHLCAIHGGGSKLDEAALRDVFDAVRLGESDAGGVPDPDVLAHAAYHEAGHAIAMTILMPSHRIESLSVGARRNSLGRVSVNTEDAGNTPMNRRGLRNHLTVFMAGRVAEVIHFGEETGLDAGAADDLRRATQLAYRAITEFGLDPDLGHVNLAGWKDADMVLPTLHQRAETRLLAWLKEAEAAAFDLLRQHQETLTRVAETLLTEEALEGERFLELMAPRAKLSCVA